MPSSPAVTGNAAQTAISGLLNADGCLLSLSDHQLKSIIVYAMRTKIGLTGKQVTNSAACYWNVPKHNRLAILTQLITGLLVPGTSLNAMLQGERCSVNGSDTRIDAELLWMFANYFQTQAL